MSKTYEDGYEDGYEAGRDDPSDDIIAEIAALQARIDALEWLREVEEYDRTMCELHPDRRKRDKDAHRRRGDARAALLRMWRSAREAVES